MARCENAQGMTVIGSKRTAGIGVLTNPPDALSPSSNRWRFFHGRASAHRTRIRWARNGTPLEEAVHERVRDGGEVRFCATTLATGLDPIGARAVAQGASGTLRSSVTRISPSERRVSRPYSGADASLGPSAVESMVVESTSDVNTTWTATPVRPEHVGAVRRTSRRPGPRLVAIPVLGSGSTRTAVTSHVPGTSDRQGTRRWIGVQSKIAPER